MLPFPLMIELSHVTRRYGDHSQSVTALDDVSLCIEAHEFIAITGPSGCGKSTLMHLLGGMDQPTSGELFVDGLALHQADERQLTEYRRRKLGIVFQFFNLLPTMTALENAALPLLLQGVAQATAEKRAGELLEMVGLAKRFQHFPQQLSGGEMQRAAIARALIHQPALLLADEPTGNLDSANAEQVLALFRTIAAQKLTTLVLVTHSEEVAALASRRIRMRDGHVVEGA
jgi:putative ABC transport system ATP-binding protein